MAQYDDRYSAGRSEAVPYKRGESASARHDRRLGAALDSSERMRQWCGEQGVAFDIKNEGHHWIMKKGDRVAEWWPSSAKLVLGRKYGSGIHTHDVEQAIRLLGEFF